MWILLFPKVTLFVSTILSPNVDLDEKGQKQTENKAFDQNPSKMECFPGPNFATRDLTSRPGMLFSEHSSKTRIRLTRQEIYSGNYRQRNQFGRWVRVDLKTEQGFCCCCCHLQQSVFELSEIHRAQDIAENAENRNDQWRSK